MARFCGMVKFPLETPLTEEQIRQACARAVDAGQQVGTTIRPTESTPAGIRYVVQSRRGSLAQVTFVVTWQETTDRRRKVHLIGERYVSGRQESLRAPVLRRTTPAMRSYHRFADNLRRELSAR